MHFSQHIVFPLTVHLLRRVLFFRADFYEKNTRYFRFISEKDYQNHPTINKQACKSSEDAQAGYAQFEKVWAG